MQVQVVDRAAMDAEWEMPGPFRVHLVTVNIQDSCPKCGGLRGRPERQRFCEDGVYYLVDCWENPCGHVDKYPDVLKEGRVVSRTLV